MILSKNVFAPAGEDISCFSVVQGIFFTLSYPTTEFKTIETAERRSEKTLKEQRKRRSFADIPSPRRKPTECHVQAESLHWSTKSNGSNSSSRSHSHRNDYCTAAAAAGAPARRRSAESSFSSQQQQHNPDDWAVLQHILNKSDDDNVVWLNLHNRHHGGSSRPASRSTP